MHLFCYVAPAHIDFNIFASLCREDGARGNLISDVYLAAMAIESGCQFISTDRDFSRFPRLRWRHYF